MTNQEKNHGAGLIHQAIPDVAETEPRPTSELLLLGALRATCEADASGEPCKACGQSSIMHTFRKLLAEKDHELCVAKHQRDQASRNWRSWYQTSERLDTQVQALETAISSALAHGDRTHLGTIRPILADAVNTYRSTEIGSATQDPSAERAQATRRSESAK